MAYNTPNEQGTGTTGVLTAFVLVIVGLILGYLVFNYGGFGADRGSDINVQIPGVGADVQGTK